MVEEEELEKLREKKLRELKEKQAQQDVEEQQEQRAEAQKKVALRRILTSDARQRLNNLKTARPNFAESIEEQLILLASQGRLNEKINDEQLKQLLKKAQSGKREINIRRK